MERIRVAHIINDMEVGGAQRQVLNLLRAADRERFEMRLFCLAKKGAFGEALEREGVAVRAYGKRRRLHRAMFAALTRDLRAWRPHVAHCSVFTANLWGRLAAMRAGVPVRIAHEQSDVSLERLHRRLIDRVLSWKTSRVLAVSDDLARRLIQGEGLAPARVETLYNAVDCEGIAAARGKASEAAKHLPGAAGRRVGVVGRLEWRKDHATLLRAAAETVRRVPDATFCLVGDGPDRPALEALAAELGLGERFHFLGERADVPALLHAFDVYALSSLTEGLSLSILEAMAAGLPVVATRVGGNPELLDDGAAGVLVPPRDPAALGGAIADLLENADRGRALGDAARRRVRERFDVHAVARRLEAIYVEALQEAGAMP